MRILVLGLDTFAAKNIAQLAALGARGYEFDVVTNDLRGGSAAHFKALEDAGHRLYRVPGGIFARLAFVWQLLRAGDYAHVELYTAGRLATLYILMLKVLRVPFAVVERGDIALLASYDPLTRLSLTTGYRYADLVLYKEVYMPEALARFRPRATAFVPNCVAVPSAVDAQEREPGRLFLWANRMIVQRRPGWLVRAFALAPLDAYRLVMLGREHGTHLFPETQRLQQSMVESATGNVTIHEFTDPMPWYRKATFFCFPAELVFGNNALLEAMAHGVIPIVTAAPGVERVVTDGVNGFIAPFEESAYREALIRAAGTDDRKLMQMSKSAVETVRERFSLEEWTVRMCAAYSVLHTDA